MKAGYVCLVAGLLLAAPALLVAGDDRAFVKEVVVAAPRADVWKAWSTAEGVKTFFAPEAKVQLVPGGAFEMYFDPTQPAGLRGSEGCTVVEFAPHERLVFTWNAPPKWPAVRNLGCRTRVVMEFSDAGPGQTRLRLTHSGWRDGAEWEEVRQYFLRVWDGVLANLQRRFTDGPRQWR